MSVTRDMLHGVLSGLFDFGRVLASKVTKDRSSVTVTVEEIDQPIEDQELWGSWAILTRPAAPSADGRSGEVLYVRRGDELIPIACRDTRWQVPDIEPGETILRSLSDVASMIRMKPDGTLQICGSSMHVAVAEKTDDEIARLEFAINALIVGVTAIAVAVDGKSPPGVPPTIVHDAFVAEMSGLPTAGSSTASTKAKIGG